VLEGAEAMADEAISAGSRPPVEVREKA
jgi:hypothetical protein